MDQRRNDKLGNLLSADQRRCFHDQGIVFPIRVVSADLAEQYRRECDLLEVQLGGRPRTVEVRQMHLHFAWAYRLASEAHVLDAVEDLLGPDLLIWATELFAKQPNDQVVSIGWHRDGPYMGLDPEQTVTAWIALTSSDASNGCMRVALESDRMTSPTWNARDRDSGARESRMPDLPEDQITDVVLQPGEMSLHDVFVLHGSGPNRGHEKRVGFAIRFTTPQARPASHRPPAILARGEDRYGYFELREPPRDNDLEAAVVEMRQSARRHLDATLHNLKHAVR